MFLKLKPTRDAGVLREIVAIADGHPFVAGFAINLPAGKPDDLRPAARRASALERMPGAVGGPPVEALRQRDPRDAARDRRAAAATR